jgi:S-adenosylmethionine:diacylglycerol 3-amino-3-carboxypropyl transferase
MMSETQSLSDYLTKNKEYDGTAYPLMFEDKDYGLEMLTTELGSGYGTIINEMGNVYALAYKALEEDDDELFDIYARELAQRGLQLGLLTQFHKYIPGKGIMLQTFKRDVRDRKKEYQEQFELVTGQKTRGFNDAAKKSKE